MQMLELACRSSAWPTRMVAWVAMPSAIANPVGANTMIVDPCSNPPSYSPLQIFVVTGISVGPA